MARALVLDAGPLAMITHPRPNQEFAQWCEKRLRQGDEFVIPEIADYEVRRELIRAGKATSLARLDSLGAVLAYLPLTTEAMREAAQLWAETRQAGVPTAPDHSLDADVILAAQARLLSRRRDEDEVVVVTDNLGHLERMTAARRWSDIE